MTDLPVEPLPEHTTVEPPEETPPWWHSFVAAAVFSLLPLAVIAIVRGISAGGVGRTTLTPSELALASLILAASALARLAARRRVGEHVMAALLALMALLAVVSALGTFVLERDRDDTDRRVDSVMQVVRESASDSVETRERRIRSSVDGALSADVPRADDGAYVALFAITGVLAAICVASAVAAWRVAE